MDTPVPKEFFRNDGRVEVLATARPEALEEAEMEEELASPAEARRWL